MPGVPRIGLEVVDVRDQMDLHIRAMTAPEAAGQRFLGTGEFVWMSDIARALREGFGEQGARVPTRQPPNIAVRTAALRDASLKQLMPNLGRRSVHSTDKARRILGWQPRPAAEVVVGCARSLLAWNAI
jgi:nucleoside-diphosphate-sugar epimerase